MPAPTTPTSSGSAPAASPSPCCSATSPPPAIGLVNSATFIVSGLDMTTETTVSALASPRAVEAARAALASGRRPRRRRHRPGLRLAAPQRPRVELLGQQLPARREPARFDILFWNNDTTRLPAGLHSDFLDLYVDERPRRGTLQVLGTPVDLGQVMCDTFVVGRLTDHIIPWDVAYRTTQLLGGKSQFVLSIERAHPGDPQPAGQPEGVIPDRRRTPADCVPSGARPRPRWRIVVDPGTRGSRLGRARRAPRRNVLGNDAHPPLDPAPGRYVHL